MHLKTFSLRLYDVEKKLDKIQQATTCPLHKNRRKMLILPFLISFANNSQKKTFQGRIARVVSKRKRGREKKKLSTRLAFTESAYGCFEVLSPTGKLNC